MDELLAIALVGSGKHPSPKAAMADLACQLVDQVKSEAVERDLLLRAAAASVYRVAGYAGEKPPVTCDAAGAETAPACSPRCTELLSELFRLDRAELLVEALDSLAKAVLRLPFQLLPRVLDHQNDAVRRALVPVVGERGRWLSQFQKNWRWVTASAMLDPGVPPDAEAIWAEGSRPERKSMLERVRLCDAPRARRWLIDAWPREKADARAEFLRAWKVGLSADDEEFLEQALSDRSKEVRETATELLTHLPESALSERLLGLADEALDYSPPEPVGRWRSIARSLTGGEPAAGSFEVHLPNTFPKEWEKVGISEKPPAGMGQREYWLFQIVKRIALSHWEARFQLSPAELVAAAAGNDFAFAIVHGWSEAAAAFAACDWMPPLWDYWFQWNPAQALDQQRSAAHRWLTKFLAGMDTEAAELRLPQLRASPRHGNPFFCDALKALGRPWSPGMARNVLDSLGKMLQPGTALAYPDNYAWTQAFEAAALAIGPAHFDHALQLAEAAIENAGTQQPLQQLQAIAAVVRLRRDVLNEIASHS